MRSETLAHEDMALPITLILSKTFIETLSKRGLCAFKEINFPNKC
jgi:hypothetical protein